MMCTAIYAQVIAITKTVNNVQVEGIVSLLGPNGPTGMEETVLFFLDQEVQKGSFVLLHVKHAIAVIDETKAMETIRLIDETKKRYTAYMNTVCTHDELTEIDE
jgi:hydrogenase maturation factor